MNDSFWKKLNYQKEFAVNIFGIVIILLIFFEEVFFIYLNPVKVILIFNFLVLWNIKKIPKKNLFLRFLRAISYNLVFLILTFFYFNKINTHSNNIVVGFIIVILISFLFYIINIKKYKFMISNEFLGIDYIDGTECFLQILTLVMSSCFEEFFFRGVLYLYLKNYIVLYCFFSVVLFICHHVATPWGFLFSKNDILIQGVFSIISSVIMIVFSNIYICISFHFMVNLGQIIMYLKKYFIMNNVNKVEEYELKDEFFDN